jgi:hypothetical protein
MKTTTIAVIALTAASVCAQPIVVPREYNYAGVSRAVDDLEARWRINWGKVGHFAKNAARIGASILFKRMDEDELYARGFIYRDDLVTRDFDDDHLFARANKQRRPQPHPQPHPRPQPHPQPHPHPPARPHPHPPARPHPHPPARPHRGGSGGGFNWGNVDNLVKGAANGLSKVDWGKVADGADRALEIGADLLGREFVDGEDLVTRDFDEDYLLARDLSRLAGNVDDLD